MKLIEIYNKIKEKYPIELITGMSGTYYSIQWVHMIEDLKGTEFIHGNELIFTTGIANHGDSWLLDFVRGLYQNHASGLVVNTGPYIKEIPEMVKEFGRKYEFPLMEIPWEVHLVDVLKYISGLLLDQEKRKAGIVNAMKDAIFYASGNSIYKTHLKRYGYYIEKNYCPVLLDMQMISETESEQYTGSLEDMLSFYFSRVVVFKFNKYIVIVLYNVEEKQILECCKKVEEYEKSHPLFKVKAIASGPNFFNVENLAESYQIARNMICLAGKLKEKVLIYDNMGIYQLLLTNQNKDALRKYAKNILGNLYDYDRKNQTDYVKILKIYMESDCSVQETAKREFCHRNTINQRIHHIKQILDRETIGIQDKVEIMMAFAILDMQ